MKRVTVYTVAAQARANYAQKRNKIRFHSGKTFHSASKRKEGLRMYVYTKKVTRPDELTTVKQD